MQFKWKFFMVIAVFALLSLLAPVLAKKSEKEDYYKIFGLDRQTFDKSALRKTYYKLARQFHPDKNPGDKEAEQKFKEITHAFDVLNDDEKRKIYDVHGEEGLNGGAGSGGSGFGGFNPQDIFDQIFGGGFGFGGGGSRKPRTHDVKVEMRVPLEDFYRGAELSLKLDRQVICHTCNGQGAVKASDISTCHECRGAGAKLVQKMIAPGFFQQFQMKCPKCHGQGKIYKNACSKCKGDKVHRHEQEVKFKLPAGSQENFIKELEEMADEAPEHDTGSVYVVVTSKEHGTFRREGSDLHTEMTITLYDALFGFTKKLTHLDGRQVIIKRSEVTQPEYVQAILEEGMPDGSRKGTLFIKYTVKLPEEFPNPTIKKEVERLLRPRIEHDEL